MGVHAWEVTDEFWSRVEPLISPAQPRSANKRHTSVSPGGGRKPKPARLVFEAIVYVLRTGCPWKALSPNVSAANVIHKRLLEWDEAGVFEALWRAGLTEYDEMEGIA